MTSEWAVSGTPFVGRVAELADAAAWLVDPHALPVLSVVGVGGIGKTRFAHELLARVRQPATFLDLSDPADAERLPELQQTTDLLVLDEWERDALELVREDVLPWRRARATATGGTASRTILLGRSDPTLVLPGRTRWVVPLRLAPLSVPERIEYLTALGISDAGHATTLARELGGHPLSLQPAADLVDCGGVGGPEVHRVRSSPEYGRLLATVVARLTDDMDADLVPALLAASAVRRLDEPLLAAMLGAAHPAVRRFPELAVLSSMRAVPGGLAVRDEVRRSFAAHQAWRRPDDSARYQRRALAELDRRVVDATDDERARLYAEMLFVARQHTGLTKMGVEDEEDGLTVRRLDADALASAIEERGDDPAAHVGARERAEADVVLTVEGAWANAAFGADGRLRAYGILAPLSQQSLATVPPTNRLAVAAQALVADLGLGALPETVADTNLWAYTVGLADLDDAAANAALYWQLSELHVRGGVYLYFVDRARLEAQIAPTLEHGSIRLVSLPLDGAVLGDAAAAQYLDLSPCSLSGWIAAAVRGEDPPVVDRESLCDDVAVILEHWADDRAIAESLLARSMLAGSEDVAAHASRVRHFVASALRRPQPVPSLGFWVRSALSELGVTSVPEPGAGPSSSAPPERGGLVRLVGEFTVHRDGRRVAIGEGVPARAVKLVALHRKVDTDRLIESLWPGTEREAGRVRLRAVLARVRKVDELLLVRDGDTVMLGTDVTVDVHRFREDADEALAAWRSGSADRRERLERAVRRFSPDLLPTDLRFDWAAEARDAQCRLGLELLDALAEELSDRDPEASADAAEGAMAIDPYDEGRYLRTAEMLLAAGLHMRARSIAERAAAAAAELEVPLHPRLASLRAPLSRSRHGALPTVRP